MKKPFRPILCLDFDGVLHRYDSGWKGAGTISDGPTEGAMAFLLAALDRFEVHIFSSRSRSLWGRWAMQVWLRRHLLNFFWDDPAMEDVRRLVLGSSLTGEDEAREWVSVQLARLRWPWFKPSAFVTIDDRAITFDGTWPELSAIGAFKPWNKRKRAAA